MTITDQLEFLTHLKAIIEENGYTPAIQALVKADEELSLLHDPENVVCNIDSTIAKLQTILPQISSEKLNKDVTIVICPPNDEVTFRKYLHEICDLDNYLMQTEAEYSKPLVLSSEGEGKLTEAKITKLYLMHNGAYILAIVDGKAVGMAAIKDAKYDNTALLSGLMVYPDYHGLGIGSRLLDESIKFAKHVRKNKYLTLGVEQANTPAIKLYLKNGFKVMATRMLKTL
jgi:ribosomal protein S18 acetylase RimI-like enzyme